MPIQQVIRPNVDSPQPGIATVDAVQQPQTVRLHIGRNGTVTRLAGSFNQTITKYMQNAQYEGVPNNGWPF